MTYSLNTLENRDGGNAALPRAALGRFGQEIALLLGAVTLVFWCLALLTHSAQDAAFFTSGAGTPNANWGGRLGAYLANTSYFALGYSVWWCVAAGWRTWFTALARWLRAAEAVEAAQPMTAGRVWRQRVLFWLALAVLLSASAGLEWSRL